jgi:hypothetical protein
VRRPCAIACPGLLLAGIIVTVLQSAIAQQRRASPPPSETLLCSALEVKVAERMGVALVTFHQANRSEGPRLGELLRRSDGAPIEFETSDGRAHTATLFRLGTCFGRGLIVFPAESVHLTAGERFRLKYPQASR